MTSKKTKITHISDSHQIPSQNKTKLYILKNCQKFKFWKNFLYMTHPLTLLDKMYKYEMDPTRTVGATEQTRVAGRTDGQSETNTPPTTLLCGSYNESKPLCQYRRKNILQLSEWGRMVFDNFAYIQH